MILRAVPATATATLIYVCLHQGPNAIFRIESTQYNIVSSVGLIFSAAIGLASRFIFNWLFFYVLVKMPRSFTFGEASIVTQGITLFFINVFLKLTTMLDYNPVTNIEKMGTILQVNDCRSSQSIVQSSLFDHSVGWTDRHRTPCRHLSFYHIFPEHCILSSARTSRQHHRFVSHRSKCCVGRVVRFHFRRLAAGNSHPLVWADTNANEPYLPQLCIVTIYMGLLGITVAATSWHLSRNQSSNTRVRKIFHILIVLVFAPGLIYQCTFLFVASGVALALLILLEIVRVMKLKPFAEILQQAVESFVDEKDAGIVAMTPIYLLVGCSLPIWLHPCPCDLTDAAGFEVLPLMAGVISVGLGDTAASVIGSKFGRIHWPSMRVSPR